VSKERVKRECQKRPIIQQKDTWNGNKRDVNELKRKKDYIKAYLLQFVFQKEQKI
jgi:hypothetical protein